MKVIFANPMANGDVFLSRNFVKLLMDSNPNNEYSYTMTRNFDICKDIPNLTCLTWSDIHPKYNINISSNWYKTPDDTLILPIWYCSCNNIHFRGTNIQTYNEMFINESSRVGLSFPHNINTDIIKLIPSVDFNMLATKEMDTILQEKQQGFEKTVLFCNNIPLSGQTDKISIANIVNKVASIKKNFLFVVSNKEEGINTNLPNVVFLNDITKKDYDLLECSYISTKCQYIIGRGSGPFVFSLIKENFERDNVTFLAFSDATDASSFGLHKFFRKFSHEVNSTPVNIERTLLTKLT